MWNWGGSGLNSLRVRIQSLRLSEPRDFEEHRSRVTLDTCNTEWHNRWCQICECIILWAGGFEYSYEPVCFNESVKEIHKSVSKVISTNNNSYEPMCCNESAEQIHWSVSKVQMNNSYEQAGLN